MEEAADGKRRGLGGSGLGRRYMLGRVCYDCAFAKDFVADGRSSADQVS